MKAALKALLLVPIAVLGVAFAVANRQVVAISFDPFAAADPAVALTAPLFLLVFLLLMMGVVIGGVATWLGQGRHRRAARRAQAEADKLHSDLDRLKTEVAIASRRAREEQGARPALAFDGAD